MYLYYGTTVENAISILKERLVTGKKASRKHCNRYVAFSKTLLEARKHGEIVFQFEKIEKTFVFNSENNEGRKNHQEVVEFVSFNGLATIIDNNPIILKNKHRFDQEGITIHLIGENMKDLNKIKKTLEEVSGKQDIFKKSVKLHKEFIKES